MRGLVSYKGSLTMPENRLEEIIDGVSHFMPLPGIAHALLMAHLNGYLKTAVSEDHLVFGRPVGLGIQKRPCFTYRVPDVTVFFRPSVYRP